MKNMIKLSNEILESIDKQLSKEAAGRLADFIKNSEKLEKEFSEKDIALIAQIKENNKLKSTIEELQKLQLKNQITYIRM